MSAYVACMSGNHVRAKCSRNGPIQTEAYLIYYISRQIHRMTAKIVPVGWGKEMVKAMLPTDCYHPDLWPWAVGSHRRKSRWRKRRLSVCQREGEDLRVQHCSYTSKGLAKMWASEYNTSWMRSSLVISVSTDSLQWGEIIRKFMLIDTNCCAFMLTEWKRDTEL